MNEEAIEFSDFERERYVRQTRIEGFGLAGQRRLKASSVMISRVGGLGGPVATALARAGVGRLVLAHGGVVATEYLNRIVWAKPSDVGQLCGEVVAQRVRDINPEVAVTALSENVSEANVERLVSQADVVIDAAPLFEERYLMNREAVRQRKPLIMGAVYSTEGYATTMQPGETPCLACIYPTRPEYWTNIRVFPSIGPVPNLVGNMLAMEAIKVLTGFGETLKHVLWCVDMETTLVRRLRINRRVDCPVCGGLPVAS